MILEESARIGTAMNVTAEIGAARTDVSTVETVNTEIVMTEMRTAESVPSPGIKNSATTGRVASSTHTAGISMQTKQRSSLMRMPMDPTRSTRTFIRTDLKQTGGGTTTVQDADSKAVAEGAAEEGDFQVGEVFKAAGEEAEGGTRIKGITSRETNRATSIKAITNNKVTTTITTSMDKEAETTSGLPGDKVKISGATNTPLKEGYKIWKGIILISLGGPIQVLTGHVLRAIWARVGASLRDSGAGETTSLRAP